MHPETADPKMTEKHCALLTMDNSDGWSIDADLTMAPMQASIPYCSESSRTDVFAAEQNLLHPLLTMAGAGDVRRFKTCHSSYS
jgi:hypothetical protein